MLLALVFVVNALTFFVLGVVCFEGEPGDSLHQAQAGRIIGSGCAAMCAINCYLVVHTFLQGIL